MNVHLVYLDFTEMTFSYVHVLFVILTLIKVTLNQHLVTIVHPILKHVVLSLKQTFLIVYVMQDIKP